MDHFHLSEFFQEQLIKKQFLKNAKLKIQPAQNVEFQEQAKKIGVCTLYPSYYEKFTKK